MTNSSRSFSSGYIGIALIAASALSAAFAGFEATSTAAAIGAFVVWGLCELAGVENEPRPRRIAVKVSTARANAVVGFPNTAPARRAA